MVVVVVMLGKVGKKVEKKEEKRKGERGWGWVLGGGVFGGGELHFGGRLRAFFRFDFVGVLCVVLEYILCDGEWVD